MASLVYPVAMFLATPVFLHQLGSGRFGIWVLINTILQLMGAFNFGLGDANIKFIAEYQAQGDNRSTREVIASTMGFSIAISTSVLVVSLLISYAADYWDWIQIPPAYHDLGYTSFRVACFLFVFRFTEVTLLSIFQGFGRYDISSRLSIVSRLVGLAANLVCLALGWGLVSILLSSLIAQLAVMVIEVLILQKRFKFISLRPNFSIAPIRKYLSFGFWTWVQTLLAIVTTQFDKMIVVALSGLDTLSYYSIGSMLMMQFHTIFISLSNWVFPAVSEKAARGEPLLQFYRNSETLLLLFGFTSVSLFILVSEPLVTIWLGQEVYPKAIRYIILFNYYNFFLVLNIIPYFFLNGSNHARQNAWSEFVLKAANILGIVLGYHWGGNEGMVWGLIVSSAVALPLKISQLRTYALKVETGLGIDSILCSALLVIGFEATHLAVSLSAFAGAAIAFYYLYLRKSSLASLFSFVSKHNQN